MSQDFRECTCCLVIKSQEGLTRAQCTAHPPKQQHSPSWDCWGEQKELLHLLVSAAQDLLCFCQRAEFHPTCSFVQVLAKWLLGDSLPLLLTLSFWQGVGQRDGMPEEASALHFPLPPLPSAEVGLVFNPSASWLGQLLHSQALSYIRGDFIRKSLAHEGTLSSILCGLLRNVHWISPCWQIEW